MGCWYEIYTGQIPLLMLIKQHQCPDDIATDDNYNDSDKN